MKHFSCTLVAVFFITTFPSAQTTDFSQWLKKKTIEGKEITMLRVPDTQFGSQLVGYISDAQHHLGRLPDYYDAYNTYTVTSLYENIERDCQQIEKIDPSFPVKHYRDEIKAFKELKIEMEQKALLRKKEQAEKEFFEKLKADYAWISSDSIQVRTKPNDKSPSIGKLFRLSYIRAYEVEDDEDWVQIDFGEHSGYVHIDDIAIDWEELAPSTEDSTRLQRGQLHYFTPTASYTAQLKKAAAEEERAFKAANAAPRRTYYTGPRGGCYYINSNGNKQYVDRSYCR